MKKAFKNLFLKLTPVGVSNFFYYNHWDYKKKQDGDTSFSQEGEDMVLRRIFASKPYGVYVDIGAHHPTLYSNTNYFYQKGWTGINIDPLPGNKLTFDTKRPNDTNLELLVSEDEGMVEFYLFAPSLMNTMSKQQVIENEKFDWCKLKEIVLVPSMPLGMLLDKYLAPGTKIDFMSVDVEGAEMTVLNSNNWEKYAPDVLLVEIIDTDIEDIFKTEVHCFLTERHYKIFAKTGNTLFYKKDGFFEF
ncbi:MAG TPA: FkbM family methyltransferase [Mucilaginibacter sp.]